MLVDSLLTFWTMASDVIGECHVPYGAAFGHIVDGVGLGRMSGPFTGKTKDFDGFHQAHNTIVLGKTLFDNFYDKITL